MEHCQLPGMQCVGRGARQVARRLPVLPAGALPRCCCRLRCMAPTCSKPADRACHPSFCEAGIHLRQPNTPPSGPTASCEWPLAAQPPAPASGHSPRRVPAAQARLCTSAARSSRAAAAAPAGLGGGAACCSSWPAAPLRASWAAALWQQQRWWTKRSRWGSSASSFMRHRLGCRCRRLTSLCPLARSPSLLPPAWGTRLATSSYQTRWLVWSRASLSAAAGAAGPAVSGQVPLPPRVLPAVSAAVNTKQACCAGHSEALERAMQGSTACSPLDTCMSAVSTHRLWRGWRRRPFPAAVPLRWPLATLPPHTCLLAAALAGMMRAATPTFTSSRAL